MSDPTGPDDIDLSGGVSDLFQAFYRAVTGGRSVHGESSLGRMMRTVEAKAGSVRAAARETGVSESSWRRWRAGKATPRPENVDKVRLARRQAMVTPRQRDKANQSTGPDAAGVGLTVTGLVVVSRDARERTLYLGRHLPPGRLDPLVDAFLAGDDQRVNEELHDIVNEYLAGGNAGAGGEVFNPQIQF